MSEHEELSPPVSWPGEKKRLKKKAERLNIPLSQALREGANRYLDEEIQRLNTRRGLRTNSVAQAASENEESDDALLAELNIVASKVQRRLSGS